MGTPYRDQVTPAVSATHCCSLTFVSGLLEAQDPPSSCLPSLVAGLLLFLCSTVSICNTYYCFLGQIVIEADLQSASITAENSQFYSHWSACIFC